MDLRSHDQLYSFRVGVWQTYQHRPDRPTDDRYFFAGSFGRARDARKAKTSSHRLHFKRIVYVFHSGHRGNILAAAARLRGCEFLFVSPQPRDSRVAFALDLREDFIKSRIIGRKKERTTKIDAGRVRTRAETVG